MKLLKTFALLLSLFFVFASNSYAQWTLQSSGTSNDLYSVYFISSSIGFAAGASGTILRTTNSGDNWTNVNPGSGAAIRGMRFADSLLGWAVGDGGTMLKTINGGLNWISQSGITAHTLRSVFFINSTTGWITGDTVILKTTNSGGNWSFQNAVTMKRYYSVFFINPDTGWIAGYSILKTTDGGQSWVIKKLNSNARSIFFTDPNSGWYVGGSYTIGRSTNGGETWTTGLLTDNPDSPPATFTGICFINPNTGWFTSSHSFGGRIAVTTNGGANWRVDYPTTPNRQMEAVYMMQYNLGWAVGANGTILRRGGVVGVPNQQYEYPHTFALEQNYPNPFNPATRINFSLPSEGGAIQTRLVVYDALGKIMATLVDEQLKPGKYEVTFDGANYPSGIYFYEISAGTFSDSRKMVLIK